ncbi:hypothetical protein TESG_05831 [Trichophyton tonsurans CBS 112818]|uniref:Uncharacterized protein n=1 Tax=Trichophyton tonsurans (strain CBS 112818) TaxID=647933 RepID=F2S4F4_TRIT1|nr:hypothetical protein TESG_05831 [Trichophyton tonsurans CBS 112818]
MATANENRRVSNSLVLIREVTWFRVILALFSFVSFLTRRRQAKKKKKKKKKKRKRKERKAEMEMEKGLSGWQRRGRGEASRAERREGREKRLMGCYCYYIQDRRTGRRRR